MISCTFENGREVSLRHVTVGALVINNQQQVLLVKRAANIWNGGKFAIPGGFLNRDENTRGGVLRELREETGLDGEVIGLFRVNDSPNRPKEDRQNVDFIYLVKIVGGEEKLNPEVEEIEWFDKYNLPPDEEFAFDHRDSILKYFQYLKQPFELPIIG